MSNSTSNNELLQITAFIDSLLCKKNLEGLTGVFYIIKDDTFISRYSGIDSLIYLEYAIDLFRLQPCEYEKSFFSDISSVEDASNKVMHLKHLIFRIDFGISPEDAFNQLEDMITQHTLSTKALSQLIADSSFNIEHTRLYLKDLLDCHE